MTGVLSGIRVAAFTHFAVGPRIAQFLGALGADVIKVESPAGEASRTLIRDAEGRFEGASPSFVTLNRNQRGVAFDLKTEGGREAARRLVDSSDVMVQNFKPGTLERLGFGYEEVSRTNPGHDLLCGDRASTRTAPAPRNWARTCCCRASAAWPACRDATACRRRPVGVFSVDAYTAMINVIAILSAPAAPRRHRRGPERPCRHAVLGLAHDDGGMFLHHERRSRHPPRKALLRALPCRWPPTAPSRRKTAPSCSASPQPISFRGPRRRTRRPRRDRRIHHPDRPAPPQGRDRAPPWSGVSPN